jgi:glycosyltransferase involved in cell wall biosynthesis
MRIGIDATCWQLGRGFGRHVRGLVPALVDVDRGNRYTLFTDSSAPEGVLPARAEVRIVKASRPTVEAATASGRRRLADLVRMSGALARAKLDVLIFPALYTYVPVPTRARTLVMVHDVGSELYPDLMLGGRMARTLWRVKASLGRWQADELLTISDYSKRAIVERFGVDPSKVHVIGMASAPVFRPIPNPRLAPRLKALGLSESHRMVVYVGGFSPHKNLIALVEAFERLVRRPDCADARLVFVGEHEREPFVTDFERLRGRLRGSGLGDRALFTGFLPDEELAVLLNVATVLALPSLIEGFGLPAVEAAACGCPVVATRESPLAAILGAGVIPIDPRQPAELERALGDVLTSSARRSEMREAGLAAASRLSWDAAARQLAAVIAAA